MWYQKTLTLSAKSRGFHLVTDEILNQLADMPRVNIGLLHLLLQHTSASLTLNENCDPTVRHWICPYISRHLLSLNPLLACCRRYSRGER